MNILHVAQSFDLCGRSRMIHDLCTGLAGRGFEFTIALLGSGPGYLQRDVPCVAFDRKEGLSLWTVLRLAKQVRKGRYHVIHSHGRGGAAYAALACSIAPRSWVHTVHRSDGDRISGRHWLRSRILDKADQVVAVSQAALKEFEKVNEWHSDRTTVIYNGVHLDRLAAGRKRSGNPRPVIGTIANLSPDKDFDTLLRGFSAFLGAYPGARLVIVGDGPSAGRIRSLAEDLGLQASVDFLGFRNDVPALLPTFDVLAHSTHTEGLGIALLEAMAVRVPVVASRVGGIPEIVSSGTNGRLFPAGDASALCSALIETIVKRESTEAMVEQGFRTVAERFSVEAMCAAYERLYRSL